MLSASRTDSSCGEPDSAGRLPALPACPWTFSEVKDRQDACLPRQPGRLSSETLSPVSHAYTTVPVLHYSAKVLYRRDETDSPTASSFRVCKLRLFHWRCCFDERR